MYEFMNLNPKGVSYNREQSGRTSNCVNARNPYGHNPECPCFKQRAAQVTPYLADGDGRPDGRTTEDVEADEVLAWNESQHIDRLVDSGREEA